ncbi:MAG: glucuronate isomerase [Gemmatimonadaceae bacterium]|nr:glucuronate isomerase [Gemmatimonadaceae bacterium]
MSTTDAALDLHPDRYFDSDPAIRRAARDIHDASSCLPLICPHGHVDPWLLASDAPFPEPTALLITPDHYVFRMLASQGVSMESMGVPTVDGTDVERDPRRIWQLFAEHFHLFLGTPTGAWLHHTLHELFGVRTPLAGSSAQRIYDQIAECLASPEFLPRALFERFRIEVLATTDGAADGLEPHRRINDSDWTGRVVPTFRPDALFRVASAAWPTALAALEQRQGSSIPTFAAFLDALVARRSYFASLGATATDHAVVTPLTRRLDVRVLDRIFADARAGRASAEDQSAFEAHMLIEMARMSTEDGLVMQLHAGSLRDHHAGILARFGMDKGADIPVVTEFTRNLQALLSEFGHDPRLTLILFTLDESTYARELAPLAGHYPAVRLGPPWWFHDSIEGMRRFREQTTETAGVFNTAGFNDDTRAFCSIPARHDLARRMDANFLGGLVARHVIGMSDAMMLGGELAYGLARRTYRFDRVPVVAA